MMTPVEMMAHLDPAHRHVSFFSAGDWQISTVANEYGLLDTSYLRWLPLVMASLNVCQFGLILAYVVLTLDTHSWYNA